MVRRQPLSEDGIAKRLREVPQWKREGNAITRTWTFDDFPPALAFINRVGEIAEAADHHPDIYNSWATVRLSLTTHDVGGLTDRDFDLARRIDALG
jgi:4a-hydroxytetrahydrobiopterin dehydratase